MGGGLGILVILCSQRNCIRPQNLCILPKTQVLGGIHFANEKGSWKNATIVRKSRSFLITMSVEVTYNFIICELQK